MAGAGGSNDRRRGLGALRRLIAANRAGTPIAAPVWTSVQPEVLRVIFAAYAHDDAPVLLQASASAVNRTGGSSGMTPLGFRNFVEILASGEGVDPARLVLLAGRLGPGLWADQPAEVAMRQAEMEVAAFVDAGFDLLHLDATPPCIDDLDLGDELRAARAAGLCAAGEAAAGGRDVGYVIGLDLPPDGGLPFGYPPPGPATPQDMHRCFALHEAAFTAHGIGAALDRIVGVVAASGADFDNAVVFPFTPEPLGALPETILDIPDATFLAPSADYQAEPALRDLATAHFGLLGVGPELGFAFREAVVAMAEIDERLPGPPSDALETLNAEMDGDPAGWDAYIEPDETEPVSRLFGLADRARLYWGRPAVAAALQRLYARLDNTSLPYGLVSQYAPQRVGDDPIDPRLFSERLIADHVGPVVARFRTIAGTF